MNHLFVVRNPLLTENGSGPSRTEARQRGVFLFDKAAAILAFVPRGTNRKRGGGGAIGGNFPSAVSHWGTNSRIASTIR
jgi:hypothetical protein